MAVAITKKKNPHLAITHNELQNGSANGRNVSLLLKSDAEITEEIAALIEKVSGVKVEVNKASYETIRTNLRTALKEKYETKDPYSWLYVEDFDSNNVVFSYDDGLFYTSYTLSGVEVTVGSEAVEVSRVVSYVEGENKIVLTDTLKELDSGVYSLIVKSFDSISKNEKLVDVIKSKEKGKKMDEIQKAVDAATTPLKTELEKAQADLKAALDQVQAFEKAAQEQKESARKSAIAEFVKEEAEVEALLKSTAALDDEAFEVIVKTFKGKAEQVEKSDLFEKQTEKTEIEKADEEALHVRLIKEKYQAK